MAKEKVKPTQPSLAKVQYQEILELSQIELANANACDKFEKVIIEQDDALPHTAVIEFRAGVITGIEFALAVLKNHTSAEEAINELQAASIATSKTIVSRINS